MYHFVEIIWTPKILIFQMVELIFFFMFQIVKFYKIIKYSKIVNYYIIN